MNLDIYEIYLSLKGVSVSDAINAFEKLQVSGPADGDRYFEAFGVGQYVVRISRPYERFACYEFLLKQLKEKDASKFEHIHKGTPYYFMSWTAFDIGDYEKAVFYLDAAFSEDIRKSKIFGESDPIGAAFKNPGGGLLLLDPSKSGPAALRITTQLREYVSGMLMFFKKNYGKGITIEDFVNKFIIGFTMLDSKNRSVVTTFYSFIYEFGDRYNMLVLRSKDLGSIEPFLLHLFKGGLIFESLLKYVADEHEFITDLAKEKNKRKNKPTTIGSFNHSSGFRKRYGEFNIKEKKLDDLSNVKSGSMKNAFGVTYRLRNFTGHDLRQVDVFEDPNDYKKLFEQEVAAILYIINKEFIEVESK